MARGVATDGAANVRERAPTVARGLASAVERERVSIDLRNADCFDEDVGLPACGAASVDVTITDPPFDTRTHRAAVELDDWRRGRRAVNGALPFAPLGEAQLTVAAAHLARITRRWIIVFAGECQLDLWRRALEAGGAKFVRFGVVERKNPRPQMTGDRPGVGADLIVIAHGTGARMRWNGRGRPARWRSGAARFDPGGKMHPTQKPLDVMRALVEDFSDRGELICDPFAGAATTAVACEELGRAFLGWERDATYFRAGLNRISQMRSLICPSSLAKPKARIDATTQAKRSVACQFGG